MSEAVTGRTLDAVADLGLDPTGTDPVEEALAAAVADDTRIEFPPGEYRFDAPISVDGVERHAWVGTGEDREAVRFVLGADALPAPLVVAGGHDLRFSGFTLVTDHQHTIRWPFDVDGRVTVAAVGVRAADPLGDRIRGEPVASVARDEAHTLSIAGRGAATSYEVTVSGTLEADSDDPEHTPAANVSGPTAEGTVSDGVDRYRFTGGVTAFSLRGPADVRLDGRPVPPTTLPTRSGSAVRVESRDGRPVTYHLGVDAPAVRVNELTAVAVPAVEGATTGATGWITDGQFDHFETTLGRGRLHVEDVVVSPDALGGPANAFLASGDLRYAVDAEGRLHTDADPTVGAGTPVDGVAEGALEASETSAVYHRFDGGVRRLALDGCGAATLTFE